ncbi:hypothetical protein HK098_002899, partial [Nowakowskiella sp. JEL0407]
MEKSRRIREDMESSSKSIMRSPKLSDEPAICEDSDGLETDTKKRKRSDSESSQTQPTRMCISQPDDQAISSLSSSSSQPSPILPLQSEHPKSIFLNGLRLEQNWRHGRYTVSSIQGSRQGIRSLCYVPRENGGELFTGGYDKIIRRYFISDFTLKSCKSESGVLATNAENSNPSFISSETVLLGHDGVVTCLRTYQNHLLSASSDRTIKIWSLKTLQLMKTLIGHMEKVTCLKGFEEGVVSAAEGGGVRVWRRAAGPAGGIGIGRRLLIGETVYDLHVEVRRNRSAQHSVPNTASWPESNNSSNAGSQPALGWDGMILILALESGVLIWDLETNVRIKLGDHVGSVQCVKYIETEEDKHQLSTPDDDEVGGSDSVFTTTNTPHDMNTAVVIQGTGGVNTIPLNGTLISCSTDGTIKYYELSSNRTPQLSKTLYGHVNGIWSLAHDSLRLISVGFGGLVRVWELDTGRSMYGLDGHRSSVNVVEMGGEKVFTADDDGIIKIWDFSPDRTKYLNR